MKKKKETKIKFLKNARNKQVIIRILYVFLVLCVILNIISLVNSTIKKIDYFNLCGISLISMESKQMGKEIPKNSLVITKEYKKQEDIEINDNIAYIVNGKLRINKIVGKDVEDGKIVYQTKSNNNYYNDLEGVHKDNIIGKVIGVVPIFGILFKILQSKIITLFIIIIFVIKFIYNKNVYKRRIKRNKTLRDRP